MQNSYCPIKLKKQFNMDDLATHGTSTSTKQRLDILSKLGTVFDKLNPVDHAVTEMKGKRQDLIN